MPSVQISDRAIEAGRPIADNGGLGIDEPD